MRSTPFPRPGIIACCLLLVSLTFHSAAGATGGSILSAAAAGVGLPPAGHDFTRVAPGQVFVPNHLLVRFASGVESAQRTQILSALGGAQIAREYELVPGLCLVILPPGQTVQQALQSYNGTPGILYAEPNNVREFEPTFPNDPRFSELWGMLNTGQTGGTPGADIHAAQAWDLNIGTRQVIVAVVDSGMDYAHPDLTNNVWTNLGEIPANGVDDDGNGYVDDVHGYDFSDDDPEPDDEVGHGTHCAGTIGAEGNNNIGVAGVCWQVRLMAVKIGGLYGISTADAIAGIQYATLMGANVMNASWGGGYYTQAEKDAIDAAGAVNIVFVAAAGNSASDNDIIPHYPSSYASPNIIAVMSTDHNDIRSGFSCYGLTSVDLAAPGTDILSCQPGGGYQLMSGTSMSTPHVTGACALLFSAYPTLSVAQVKQALMSTVDPVVPGLCVSGGRFNMFRALTSLLPGSPLVLQTNYLSGGNGNGIIDFNECNNLDVVLTNLGNTTVTGVRASLSTTTPGVAIAQATSAYPDFPPGSVGTNYIPFKVSTTPSFVCGTPIEFSIVVKSDQNVAVYQFSLPTGVPGTPFRFNNDSPVPIPSPGRASSSILVSNIPFAVNKVSVSLFVQAFEDYYLKLELIAPDGTTNVLSSENTLFGENFGLACSPDSQRTTFDDQATIPIASGVAPYVGSFRPAQPLSIFTGKSGTNVNGLWQLRVTDSGGFSAGSIQCWSLSITPTLCVDGGGQCPGSDFALGMTAHPNPIIAGNNLTYSLMVTNNGPSSATNVSVTYLLPGSALFVSATTSQGTFAQSGSLVTFNLGRMEPSARVTMTVVALPMTPGTIFATANVVSEQPDFVPGNNSTTVLTQVSPPTTDLAVAMDSAPNPALVGSPLTYTVSVANNGPSPASGITVTNALPPNAAFLSATGSLGSFVSVGQVVFWSLPGLSSGSAATATIVVAPLVEGTYTATATAGGAQYDPVDSNNIATNTTAVGPAADLAIGLTDFPDPVVAGSNVTYVIAVTNFGPSAASSVIVNDTLPAGVTVVSTNPAQGTVTVSNTSLIWNVGALPNGAKATLTYVVRTSANGTLNTTATVIAAQADANPANNSAAATTVVTEPFITIAAASATLTAQSFSPPNGAIDAGETVTVILRLRNAGNISTRNLVGTLATNAGVLPVPPNNPQTYGVLAPSGFPVGRSFSFTASGTNGQTITATLLLRDGTTNYPPVNFSFTLPNTQGFANPGALDIPDPDAPNPPYPPQSGPGKPYPSVITVSNLTGVLGKVTVTLSSLSHTFPGDVNVLLVGPTGAKTLLMSDAGSQPCSGQTLTFDDTAASPLPAAGGLTTASWQPSAYNANPGFPTNAPAGPYSAALSTFNAINPNGEWSLYVFDDTDGDEGVILGGWSLALTMLTPVNQLADVGITGVAVPNPCLVGSALTYTFILTNTGPNTATSVAFTNNLPAGVALVSATPSQGTVLTNATGIIGSLGSLNPGTNATVTVVVMPTAALLPPGGTNATLINTATVGADEGDLNPGNNSVTVSSTVTRPVADLAVIQSVVPDPLVVGYHLTNSVLVTNRGPGVALDVVLTQTLPPTAGFVSASSSIGSCTNIAGVVTCTLGNLDANSTATVTIILTNSLAGLMTNRVTLATSSYDPNPANNSATYVTTVANPAPSIVNAGAVLMEEGQGGAVNGVIDPGETVKVKLFLANVGSLDTINLKATLQPSGGVNSPSGPQYYGHLSQGGPSAAGIFSFKAAAVLGSTLVATLQLRDEHAGVVTNNLGTVDFVFSPPATSAWVNTNTITIPDYGVGTPYPSSINVTGLVGRVSKATVTLNGVRHGFPHDINVLLVSPSGTNVLTMSHTGGGHSVTNITLTFDDTAAGSLANYGPISSGVFKPTSYEGPVHLPGTAPSSSYRFALSDLSWTEPNGAWLLYVYDDSIGDAGSIARGWSLNLTTVVTVGPVVNLAVSLSSAPSLVYVGENLTNTITVRNSGPDWATGVMLTNPLPSGFSYVSSSLSQGSISGTGGGLLICSLGNLPPGEGARVTIVSSPSIPGSFLNTVTAAVNEEDLSPANNFAQTGTTVSTAASAQLFGSISNGQFHLTVSAQPSVTYAIQTSTNLASWVSISTNTASLDGIIHYTDTNSPNFGQRYYRTQRLTP